MLGFVCKQTGPVSYQVDVRQDVLWRRHADQLRSADFRHAADVEVSEETTTQIGLPVARCSIGEPVGPVSAAQGAPVILGKEGHQSSEVQLTPVSGLGAQPERTASAIQAGQGTASQA